MKRFVLHIIGFAVLLIGSYAGYYAYKMHQTRLPKADIYAWGDSRMYWGLNSELLEELTGKKVISTAQEGASVYDMLVFVDRVPDHSVCIIGYSECVLFRLHESDYNRSGCNWKVLAQMEWNTNYTMKELYGIAKQNIWEPKQIATEAHDYFENGDTVCTPEPWEGWYKMYTDTFPRFEAKGICYEMAIRKLLDKQCTVVLLDLPGYPKMERLAADGSRNRQLAEALTQHLCDEFAFSQDTIEIESDSLLYYDLSHLNERGSVLLAKELQNHLEKTKCIRLKLKNENMIPFNKPHLVGKEAHYMYQAVMAEHLSGNGPYTKKCQQFFQERYGFKKCLLTTSGTDALEMCAMLCDLKPGDEVIIPSYTFVSTALAFLREGAKVVFADSMKRNPNLDAETIESLITPRTKVIVPVHYAGVACDMDRIMEIANRHNLLVVEDAAQAVDSYYVHHTPYTIHNEKLPLGGIGHLAAFSFHETKNITAGGEGGLLVVNDEQFIRRAEILWEKGTNRAEFFRGAVNKYGWVDMGSSFLPAEINAAFLWAQLENLDEIQEKRKTLWNKYYELLKPLADKGYFSMPDIPEYATNNAHMFYLVCRNLKERTALIKFLKEHEIQAVFHYLSLHSSEFYKNKHDGRELPECDRYMDTLVRLPLFYDLEIEEVELISSIIIEFYNK